MIFAKGKGSKFTIENMSLCSTKSEINFPLPKPICMTSRYEQIPHVLYLYVNKSKLSILRKQISDLMFLSSAVAFLNVISLLDSLMKHRQIFVR